MNNAARSYCGGEKHKILLHRRGHIVAAENIRTEEQEQGQEEEQEEEQEQEEEHARTWAQEQETEPEK
jgi:hypothetical protein